MMDDGIVIALLTLVVGVMATAGYGKVSTATPNFRAARICFWIAAVSCASIGIFLAEFAVKPSATGWWIVGVAAVALLLVLRWVSRQRAAHCAVHAEKTAVQRQPQISVPNVGGTGNVVSVAQSGGITAHTVVNQADPPRRLTGEQMAAIRVAASQFAAALPKVEVTACNGNQEALRYASDFVDAFRSAGVSADLALPIPTLRPDIEGVRVGLRGRDNIPASAKALASILAHASIPYSCSVMDPSFFPDSPVVLVIGAKPSA